MYIIIHSIDGGEGRGHVPCDIRSAGSQGIAHSGRGGHMQRGGDHEGDREGVLVDAHRRHLRRHVSRGVRGVRGGECEG